MRALVQLRDVGGVGRVGKLNSRTQYYFGEFSGTVGVETHRTIRLVAICTDSDSGLGTKVEKPQHMTGR